MGEAVGDTVKLQNCNGNRSQRFVLYKQKIMTVTGFCLDVANGGRQGKRLVLSYCKSTPTQRWKLYYKTPSNTVVSAFKGARLRNNQGLCMAPISGRMKPGSVVMRSCKSQTPWRHDSKGSIHVGNGLCLSASNGLLPGKRVIFDRCSNHINQRFLWSAGQLVTFNGLCVDTESYGRNGAPAILWHCNRHRKTQIWKPKVSANHDRFELRNKARGLCLDENSGKMRKGGTMILWSCGQPRQRWQHTPQHTLRTTSGLCLDAQAMTRGAKVTLAPCHGGPSQRFVSYRGRLTTSNGMCLDATKNGRSRGRIVVMPCKYDRTQRWSIHR